ncbi:hypothetical protein B0H14DRAFT_2996085 [Mycena olivaceomarginata]|nr:hypothetical protein B0H14DRAFT_2996085 [Mycena olivaceomarginata]
MPAMVDTTIRLSRFNPEFIIPPSDPDPMPISRRETAARVPISPHPSGASINSLASSNLLAPPTTPVRARTPRNPSIKRPRACCCACHEPVSGPASSPGTPADAETSPHVHRDQVLSQSRSVGTATHECSPVSLTDRDENSPFIGAQTKPLKSTPVRESKARSQRDAKRSDSIAVSEMGELAVRPRVETRINRYSKTRAFFKSWTAPSLKATRLKRQPRLSMRVDAHHPRRFQIAPKAGCTTPKAADSDSSFLKMSGGAERAEGRRLRRSDGSVVSVNRFGWVCSRKSGKGSYSAESVATRPEVSAVTVNDTTPPRPRAFFEVVGLSPIIEDAQSFPSFGDLNCSFDTFSVVRGGNFDRNVTPNGRYREQEQAYQDSDSRNFDHMNLSGSFVLQSTSCRDLSSACYPETAEEESVPALVLTFPTPEPPKSPVFIPQSPFTVHKFVAAMAPGPSASAECIAQLAVPALPRCTHCGFGFGLDLDDLEAPLSSNPCRFCEPQWLACKMWYQARGDRLREPCAVRPAESNASRRAIVGKLGLPVGSHRGLALGTGTGVDEMGQMDDKQAAAGRGAEGYGYSRFSNVIIKDRTRTTKRTAARGRGRAADR